MDKTSSVLKFFVIAAGTVLIAGTILLVVLIALRAGGKGAPTAQPAPQDLMLPAGARIEQVVVDGERLVLLGTDGAGAQFVAVVDAATGERLSLLRVPGE